MTYVQRRLLAVLASVVTVAVTAGAPARAADEPREHRSAAFVTRLTLDATGRGWLTVQLRLRSARYGGFVLSVGPPYAQGEWTSPAVVPIPGLDVDCVRRTDQPGVLLWDCGSAGDREQPGLRLPAGSHTVTLPVRWTGDPAAHHVGNVRLQGDLGAGRSGDVAWDSFRVRDATEPRSTAEVAAVELDDRRTPEGHTGRTVVVTNLDVAEDEAVAFVDVDLPFFAWRLVGSNAARHGLDCWVRQSRISPYPGVHCISRTPAGRLRAGRYALALTLDYATSDYFSDAPTGFDGYVRLGVGHPPDAVDAFSLATAGPWWPPPNRRNA